MDIKEIKPAVTELPVRITLFQALPKKDKMELVIQKAIELGATRVVPVKAKRCVVKLDDKKEQKKISRWQTIAEAAAKQSKRGIIPKVQDVMNFREAIEYSGCAKIKMIPYELSEGMDQTRKLIEGLKPGEDIAIFIGPEGGFDKEEIEMASDNGISPITLGRRILRTETAGMTVLSILMYHLER